MSLSSNSISNKLQVLSDYGVKHLFHMTSIENLPNIMSHGLFSHNMSRQQQVLKSDISNQDVNNKRATIICYSLLGFLLSNVFLLYIHFFKNSSSRFNWLN